MVAESVMAEVSEVAMVTESVVAEVSMMMLPAPAASPRIMATRAPIPKFRIACSSLFVRFASAFEVQLGFLLDPASAQPVAICQD